MSEKNSMSVLDTINLFRNEASSNELGAGVHENIRITKIDTERRKDRNNVVIKRHLFITFKKFNKNDEDIGEKEVSFFDVDPVGKSPIKSLAYFISDVRSILSCYYTEEELDEKFDPIKDALFPDGMEEDIDENDFTIDNISKYIKKVKDFSKIEKITDELFYDLMKDKIGFSSKFLRLKLEESSNGKFIQLPRYGAFIEPADVKKEESLILNA